MMPIKYPKYSRGHLNVNVNGVRNLKGSRWMECLVD